MMGEAEFYAQRPPTASGTSRAPTATTSLVASSAAIALPTCQGELGQLIAMSNAQNYRIVFGASGVAAADGNSMLFPLGLQTLWVPKELTHYRVIRDTADGLLTVYAMSAP